MAAQYYKAPVSLLLLVLSLFLAITAQSPPDGKKNPRISAVGIAVQDLSKSRDFYSLIGMKQTGKTLETALFSETLMEMPVATPGSALVLMKWATPKNTTDVPIKLVFSVADVNATIAKIRAAGAKIVVEPGSIKYSGVSIPTAFAEDPNGYLLELNPLTMVL